MRKWLLDLRVDEDACNIYDENGILFLSNGLQAEGLVKILRQLRVTFKRSELYFNPQYKELTSKWGYEYGEFSMNQSSGFKGQYSVVWSLGNSGKWRILSHVMVLGRP